MDCNDNGGMRVWNWQQQENNIFQKDTNFGISESMWMEVTQNEEDISFMFDETTPVKACRDSVYNAGDASKELEEYSDYHPQVKRRRMLQFDSLPIDPSLCCDEASSAFLLSDERDDSVEEVFPDTSQWNSRQPVACNEVDQATDMWLANCINDTDMAFTRSDGNYPGTPSDAQIDISELWNDQPEPEVSMVQQQVAQTPRKIIFRGRKSYIRPPPKLASSVAYPFAFVKPCGVHGDITLKDINRRILSPPQKMKQTNEDPYASYPTSAFSGKPVVGKMKIRTEGGRGSITVMRTKG